MEIKIKNVSYKNIFNDLNIEISKNEITALIGKNSSGKTSIMNLIYGLESNFEGEIKLGRKSLTQRSKQKEILELRKNIEYIKQDYEDMLFNINAYEDIKYGLNNISESKLNELLDMFELDIDTLNKSYLELSNGEKKKILLIKMFLSNSKIILLDDVTNGLDSKSVSNLVKLLKREKRDDKVIIISSCDSNFLLSVADSFLIIDNGVVKYIDKYSLFENVKLLNKLNMSIPDIIKFKQLAESKKIKLMYRDNINDLIKDIYRNEK